MQDSYRQKNLVEKNRYEGVHIRWFLSCKTENGKKIDGYRSQNNVYLSEE